MVKYLRFHNSSFALRYFLMQMARPQCDAPLVFLKQLVIVSDSCLAFECQFQGQHQM